MRKSLCVLLAMVLAVSAFSGCTVQQNPDADDGKLHVVTTIFAPYDFARQVGGGRCVGHDAAAPRLRGALL